MNFRIKTQLKLNIISEVYGSTVMIPPNSADCTTHDSR